MFTRNDPAEGQPRTIEVGMHMTVKQFIEKNHLGMGPREQQGYGIDVDNVSDWAPILFDDNWITLRIVEGDQSFDLPAGRTLQVTQTAGRINGLAFRPFAQPRPLPEMTEYVTGLISTLEEKGWQPSMRIKVPSKPEDFESNGKSSFAELTSPGGSILQLNLRDYGLAPKQESYVFSADVTQKPAAESQTYLLQVSVDYIDGETNYGDLIYPRRIFETGDVSKPLPLRFWIEDPDWAPEKAGMIPTSPDERASPESSKWKMPAR